MDVLLGRGYPPVEARNVNGVWDRLRRSAQKHGIRGLKFHATRHTWAT